MAYEEYILRSKREEVEADSRLWKFLEKIQAEILATGPRTILVRVAAGLTEAWPVALDKDWTVSAEQKYQVPDTRKRIGKKTTKATPVRKTTTRSKPAAAKKSAKK